MHCCLSAATEHAALSAWISAPKDIKQNGLRLKVLQSPCLPEITAVCEEPVVTTEIQVYQLIKTVTLSTARQFQDLNEEVRSVGLDGSLVNR